MSTNTASPAKSKPRLRSSARVDANHASNGLDGLGCTLKWVFIAKKDGLDRKGELFRALLVWRDSNTEFNLKSTNLIAN